MLETAPALFKHWRRLGKSSLRWDAAVTIYIDPIEILEGAPKADIILLTHNHPAHCSSADVERAADSQTIVVGPANCVSRFKMNQMPLEAGQSRAILGVSVQATPAYRLNDSRHPKELGGLGYLLENGGTRFFHSGDTDFLPELRDLKADAGFFSLGEDLLSAQAAIDWARMMGMSAAAPMHVESGSILENDFAALAKDRGIAAWLPDTVFAERTQERLGVMGD